MTGTAIGLWTQLQSRLASESIDRSESADMCSEIVNLALQEQRSTANSLDELLRSVSPLSIRAHWRLFGQGEALREVGIGRFLWTCMAAASGKAGDADTIARVAQLCELWLQTQLAQNSALRLADFERLDLEIHTQEEIRRFFSFDTRLRWVTREVVSAALEVAGLEGGAEWLDELLRKVSDFGDSARDFETGCLATTEFDRFSILHHASFVAGSGATHGFASLIASRRPELYPFIRLPRADGTDEFWPADLRTIHMGLEVAVFEALPHLGLDKGTVYEQTVRELLRRWLPWGAQVLEHPAVITGGGQDELETDVVVSSGLTVDWLADAKCYSPAQDPGASAFDHRYLAGARQVQRRLDALHRGEKLSPKGSTESPQFQGQQAIGTVVTTHSCGASVWKRDLLRQNEVPASVAMIPLHQLVLVASLMRSKDDFLHYWKLRADLIDTGIFLDDEHEILLLSYQGRNAQKRYLDSIRNRQRKGRVVGMGYTISSRDNALRRTPLRNDFGRTEWRRWFYEKSTQVDLPDLAAAKPW